jgi:hypothetical protein
VEKKIKDVGEYERGGGEMSMRLERKSGYRRRRRKEERRVRTKR